MNATIAKSLGVPVEFRSNFIHLVLDIAGFGILNGSAVTFVQVYATRLGASAGQLALISSLPAVVTLAIALPAGAWLRSQPVHTVTVRSAILYRFFYLGWVVLPLVFEPAGQLNWLLGLILLMSIPGTVLAISFNNLYAEALPTAYRARVMTWRQAAYALSSILVSLIAGGILDLLPFPAGYQAVFLLGFLGGMWSSFHLWRIKPLDTGEAHSLHPKEIIAPGQFRSGHHLRLHVSFHSFMHLTGIRALFHFNMLQRRFARLLLLFFLIYTTQYFPIPLFPLRYVRELALSDTTIGAAHAVFYGTLFLSATQYARIEGRLGAGRSLGLAFFFIAQYPLWLAFATSWHYFFIANAAAGAGSALLLGAASNFLLSQIPEENRAPYLAWYNLALNGAILTGSLLGPQVARWFGLTETLLLAFGLRALSGVLLWTRRP